MADNNNNIRDFNVSLGTIMTAGTIVGVGYYLGSLVSLGRNLTFIPKLQIFDVNFKGITFNIKFRIFNPTNATISLQQPNVFVYANKKTKTPIAYPIPSAQRYELNRNGETNIDDIKVFVSWDGLAILIADMKLNNKNQIKFIIDIQTRVFGRYLLAKNLKHTIEEDVIIPKAIIDL